MEKLIDKPRLTDEEKENIAKKIDDIFSVLHPIDSSNILLAITTHYRQSFIAELEGLKCQCEELYNSLNIIPSTQLIPAVQ